MCLTPMLVWHSSGFGSPSPIKSVRSWARELPVPMGGSQQLASGLVPGSYRIDWEAGGSFLRAVAATVELVADRHYHVPLLASRSSAVVYLGV